MFQWNPETFHIGEVRSNVFETKYISLQCKDLGDTEKKDYQYQYQKVDESIFNSINSVQVNLDSQMKRKLCSIATPDVSDIPEMRTLVPHSRHLKASMELISDLWCIGIKKATVTLDATTKRGTRSDILPLYRRYRAGRVYSLKRLNARFATDTLFLDIKSLNKNVCAQVFSNKVGFSETYPMLSGLGDTI